MMTGENATTKEGTAKNRKPRTVSLQAKLLVAFTLVFTVVFAGAFYWFYRFATETAMTAIVEDLRHTLDAAAAGVPGETLVELYEEAEPRDDGFTDDPRYWEHVNWLATVERIEPRAMLYTYVPGPNPGSVVFIGSGSAINYTTLYDIDGAKFQQYYEPTTRIIEGFSSETIVDHPYMDNWGEWITGYRPIITAQGERVGGIGIDFRAEYVREVQQRILDQAAVAFAITYLSLFILVYALARFFTRPIHNLTGIAEKVGEGNYNQDFSPLRRGKARDEITILAEVFESMVNKVYQREQKLKREVLQLKIEIDEAKRQKQVSEIVESDFFKDLQGKAKRIRERDAAKSKITDSS
jgi:hypothetical protein